MLRRTRVLLAASLAVVSFVVAPGCGGGGKGGGVSGIEPVILPPQQTEASFMTRDRPVVQQVGDFKFTVPSGTLAAPALVTISRSIPAVVPQFGGYTLASQPGWQIRVSTVLNGPISMESVTPVTSRGTGKIVWRFIKGSASNWRIVSSVVNDAVMMIEPTMFATGNVIDGIVGHFLVSPPDTGTGFMTLAVNPAGNPYSVLIFVHGFNNQAEDLQIAADKFNAYVSGDRLSALLSFRYDYRRRPADVAVDLAAAINRLRYANIYVVAHSEGAIDVRDVVENGRCGHANFTGSVCLINGPHLGTKWANWAEQIRAQEEDVLNNHPASAQSLLAAFSDPVVADLAEGSSYLSGLNSARHLRPANVAYLLIGGDDDPVVSHDSSQGIGIAFETMLCGVVNRRLLKGDHSSLVKSGPGLDLLLDTVYTGWTAGLRVTTIPAYETNAKTNGWDYVIELVNTGHSEVVADDVAIDNYNVSRVWTSRHWVTDLGGRLTSAYRSCRIRIPAGETRTVPIHEWVDEAHSAIDQVGPNLQARLHYVGVRYSHDGYQLAHPAVVIRLYHDSIRPPDPLP